jgi:CO/xanthine dehydrogenase Mo-binding subunit
VDELTGKVDVKNYLTVTDGGKVINPQLFEQQIHGAVAQSIGYALSEEVLLQDGKILNPNLADYVIPTSCDVPDISSIAVETVETTGPFGMKGIGEVATNAPLPAIASAVEDASGRRITRVPLMAGIGD